jgi:hypothetical protein
LGVLGVGRTWDSLIRNVTHLLVTRHKFNFFFHGLFCTCDTCDTPDLCKFGKFNVIYSLIKIVVILIFLQHLFEFAERGNQELQGNKASG